MKASLNRRGFTLIEMLVVISIIAVLATLGVVAANAARQLALKQRTTATLATIHQGLLTATAERGGTIMPAEHPFAGSLAPRVSFVRTAQIADPDLPPDEDLVSVPWPYAAGNDVATTGLALSGVDPRRLHAVDRTRLLLAEDRCADVRLPRFFGVPRWRMGILAAQIADWTRRQELRIPPLGVQISTPAEDDPRYGGRPLNPDTGAVSATNLMESLLARGGHLSELRQAGAIRTAPDDTTLCFDNRVYGPTGQRTEAAPWYDETGTIVTYLLRGTALYDAWGREILYGIDPRGRMRLESSGRDGFFRWTPGSNGVIDTAAEANEASGDDGDGARDNPVIGGE